MPSSCAARGSKCRGVRGVALPASVLLRRLKSGSCASTPGWACYLPQDYRPTTPVKEDAADFASPPAAPAPASAWWQDRVWALARDPEGCRQLQGELDRPAMPAAARAALLAELHGHVAEGVRCPQANFVLQKCVTTCPPDQVQFIADEIAAKGPGAISQVARHKYGCRIVQRLLEALTDDRVRLLSEGLLVHARECALDIYGNYVMQHLVEHGSAAQRNRILAMLQSQIVTQEASESRQFWAVVVKALTFGAWDDQVALVRLIQSDKGMLKQTGCVRLERIVARLVLDIESKDSRRRGYAIEFSACVGGG